LLFPTGVYRCSLFTMTYIFKCIVRPIISVFRASDTQKIKDILSLRVTTRRQSPPIKQTTSDASVDRAPGGIFRLEPHSCIWNGQDGGLSAVPCYAFAELLDPSVMAPFIGRAGGFGCSAWPGGWLASDQRPNRV